MKRIEQTPPERHKGNGQPKIEGKFFTRSSTLASALSDQGGLIQWKAKMAAKGIADDETLRSLAAATPVDDYRWRDLVERACEVAGGSNAADTGTLIHAATEAIDYGEPTDAIPETTLADAEAYQRVMDEYDLKPLCAEVFVANAGLGTAGSFDRLVTDGSSNYILDIKTIKQGRDPAREVGFKGLQWSVQIATYANSRPYDATDGYLTWQAIGFDPPSVTKGFVAAIPRGSGECFLVDIDLEKGFELAQLAAKVREARRAKPASVRLPQQTLNTEEGS